MGIRIGLLAIIAWSACACAGENGEPSLGKLSGDELTKLLGVVAEQNVSVARGMKSIRVAGVKDAKLDPSAFDGLEKELSEIDFVTSGDRYRLEYKVDSVPPEKTSTRVTCRFDGENWGRLEDDQYDILFTSKTNQRSKVVILGTNFFFDPFLPVAMLGRGGGIYEETFPADIANVDIWKKCFASAVSAEVIDAPKFGKLAAVSIADNSDAKNGRMFCVYFSPAKAFYPVRWSMNSMSGHETEFSIIELGEVTPDGAKISYYYPKKARLIRKMNGKLVSEAEFQITTLMLNQEVEDDQFSLPIEDASSIFDIDAGVSIVVPK